MILNGREDGECPSELEFRNHSTERMKLQPPIRRCDIEEERGEKSQEMPPRIMTDSLINVYKKKKSVYNPDKLNKCD